ncbi:MAG: hypothetical protein MJ093_01475 [Saccharofermentans sp.]|nr:hypothetical protein [Saccharofermentans sp.]
MGKKLINKEIIIRVVLLMVGLIIAHFGVTLFILADLGADPFNVFVQGVFRTLGPHINSSLLTHGNTHLVISVLIIIVLLIVDRSYVKIGTVLCMAFGGPIIDVFTFVLKFLFTDNSPLWYRLIFNALGCVILAYGMTMVIKSEAGTGPNDLVAVVISDKVKKKFSIVRVIVDIVFVAIGFALGGSLGVGTLVCAFLVGPVAGVFLPINEKIVKKFVS